MTHPMHPTVLREIITGIIEDRETYEGCIPETRYPDLVDALTEAWLKDRHRATTEAKREATR